MDTVTQKIFDAYKLCFNRQPMNVLSKDKANKENLVDDETLAFNYDGITKKLFRNGFFAGGNLPKSVDSLYINNKVCFIEFKNGLKPNGINNDRYCSNAIESAQDSLQTHSRYLTLNSTATVKDSINMFVLVINSGARGRPSVAYGVALAKRADLHNDLKTKLSSSLLKPFKDGLSYSKVDVWNDKNFSILLQKMS